MTDTHTDAIEWTEPDDGPLTGYAAVGFVASQRLPEGRYEPDRRPEKVIIQYRKAGWIHTDTVLRCSGRTSGGDGGNCTFSVEHPESVSGEANLHVSGVVAAKPLHPDDE